MNIPPDRLTPAPGAQALESRQICEELTRATGTIGRRGVGDFDAIDAAGAEFLLALVNWERDADARLWPYVLSAYGDVLGAVGEAAQRSVLERDGEGWRS